MTSDAGRRQSPLNAIQTNTNMLCAHAYFLALPLGQYLLWILSERRQAQQHGKHAHLITRRRWNPPASARANGGVRRTSRALYSGRTLRYYDINARPPRAMPAQGRRRNGAQRCAINAVGRPRPPPCARARRAGPLQRVTTASRARGRVQQWPTGRTGSL